jgi:4'-phosphopantetheinyl transferase
MRTLQPGRPGLNRALRGSVHVWTAPLNPPDDILQALAKTLSGDELARAERYRSPKDAQAYVAGRGVLRALLGYYLDREPGNLRFAYGQHGKPTIEGDLGAQLFFNASHSGDIAVYAIALHRRVGVDVERIRALDDIESVAKAAFSQRELASLLALTAELRLDAFYRCWARKESFVKAKGDGLSRVLQEFDVSLAPWECPAILETRDDPLDASRWSVKDLTLEAGYMAALTAEGRDWDLQCFRWPPF